jgi:hypothetical protein
MLAKGYMDRHADVIRVGLGTRILLFCRLRLHVVP